MSVDFSRYTAVQFQSPQFNTRLQNAITIHCSWDGEGGVMECHRVAEVKDKLSSPEQRALLEKYSEEALEEPLFWHYHRTSTIVEVRRALDMPFGERPGCGLCRKDRSDSCQVVEIFQEVIKKRPAGQRKQPAPLVLL
jgi:hypothetical protein